LRTFGDGRQMACDVDPLREASPGSEPGTQSAPPHDGPPGPLPVGPSSVGRS